MRRAGDKCIVLSVGAFLCGCAQGPSKPVEAGPAFTPSVAGETVSLAQMVLVGADVTLYKAMGEQEGTLHVTRAAQGDSPAKSWTVTEAAEMSGGKPTERVVTMVALEDGSLAISREVNQAERVIVDFDPPLVVYPAQLKGGEVLEQKLRMIVHPIGNPTKVQNQGDAKHTIRFEGRERLQTPLGVLEAVKILGILEADLGGPQVRNEMQEWLAPGKGIVAMKEMERTTLLGIRVRANNEWWVIERVNR